MPDIKKHKKLDKPSLTIFPTTEKNITRPSKKRSIKSRIKSSFKKMKTDKRKRNMVDFHLDIAKKIDAMIAENEKEKEIEFEEPKVVPQKHLEKALNKIIERRWGFRRKTEIPSFKPDIKSADTMDMEDELPEIESTVRDQPDFRFITHLEEPKDILFVESTKVEDESFTSKMLGNQDVTNKKMTMRFGLGKTKNKSEKTKHKTVERSSKPVKKSSSKKIEVEVDDKKPVKHNNFTKAEKEMENYKRLIEEKKKELELTEKIAKGKEEELKKKAKEKIKKDRERKKLERLNAKRLEEENRRTEKELRMKKKAEELMKKIELKKAQRDAKIKEREARERARMLEKKKLAEKKKIETKKEVKTEKIPKKKKVKPKKEKPLKVEKRHVLFGKKESVEEEPVITEDEDLIKVLTIVDDLLEKLPDEAIDEFVQSDDFELYEKVVSKYKIK